MPRVSVLHIYMHTCIHDLLKERVAFLELTPTTHNIRDTIKLFLSNGVRGRSLGHWLLFGCLFVRILYCWGKLCVCVGVIVCVCVCEGVFVCVNQACKF
jgi:hypothetical protein